MQVVEIYGERSEILCSSSWNADVVAVMAAALSVCVLICGWVVNGVKLYVLVSVWWHCLLQCHQIILIHG